MTLGKLGEVSNSEKKAWALSDRQQAVNINIRHFWVYSAEALSRPEPLIYLVWSCHARFGESSRALAEGVDVSSAGELVVVDSQARRVTYILSSKAFVICTYIYRSS